MKPNMPEAHTLIKDKNIDAEILYSCFGISYASQQKGLETWHAHSLESAGVTHCSVSSLLQQLFPVTCSLHSPTAIIKHADLRKEDLESRPLSGRSAVRLRCVQQQSAHLWHFSGLRLFAGPPQSGRLCAPAGTPLENTTSCAHG